MFPKKCFIYLSHGVYGRFVKIVVHFPQHFLQIVYVIFVSVFVSKR